MGPQRASWPLDVTVRNIIRMNTRDRPSGVTLRHRSRTIERDPLRRSLLGAYKAEGHGGLMRKGD